MVKTPLLALSIAVPLMGLLFPAEAHHQILGFADIQLEAILHLLQLCFLMYSGIAIKNTYVIWMLITLFI